MEYWTTLIKKMDYSYMQPHEWTSQVIIEQKNPDAKRAHAAWFKKLKQLTK